MDGIILIFVGQIDVRVVDPWQCFMFWNWIEKKGKQKYKTSNPIRILCLSQSKCQECQISQVKAVQFKKES